MFAGVQPVDEGRQLKQQVHFGETQICCFNQAEKRFDVSSQLPFSSSVCVSSEGAGAQDLLPDPRLLHMVLLVLLVPGLVPVLVPGLFPVLFPGLFPVLVPGLFLVLVPGFLSVLVSGLYPVLVPGLFPVLVPGLFPVLVPGLFPVLVPGLFPVLVPSLFPVLVLGVTSSSLWVLEKIFPK